MKRPLVSVLLSGVLLLTAGAARSWADTISFSNSSIHPDGMVTIDVGTVGDGLADITGMCGDMLNGCLDLSVGAFAGPVTGLNANDSGNYLGETDDPCQSMPALCFGSPTGTFAPETFTSVLGFVPDLSPTSVGNDPYFDPNPYVPFSVASMPVVDGAPCSADSTPCSTDTGFGNTNELLAEPEITATPEAGSLILVGLGLIAGAKYLRRRKLA